MAFGVMAAMVALKMAQGASAAKQASMQSVAQNKMVSAYNAKVMQSSMDQVTELNMQRAQQRQQTTAAMYNAGLQGQSARDQISLQAAASDTIGASVNDAIKTVNQKQSQAVGSAQDSFVRAIDQSNLMLKKVLGDASASMKDAVDDKGTQILNQAGMEAAGSVLGYFGGQMAGGTVSPGTAAPTSTAATTSTGATDLWGRNADAGAGNNPFGLSFKFQSSNLLGN
ncbi:putative internal virion protein [Erwinia phage Loshitsa2]|uniref:Internal virion protein n=1 Tax=Erwinia phage Loshitsa2 TaxID=2923254 RepID=A0AAE9FIB3_9CAUD|nr:putative internal virion protein [Erwinia phage Loshitsa2]